MLIRADVIIYNMGKTGSQSMVDTITSLGKFKVYNTYFLSGSFKKHRQIFSLWNDNKGVIKKKSLYSWIMKVILVNKKAKVISIVRDPLARNISHFFEVLDILSDKYQFTKDDLSFDELLEKFYIYQNPDYFQEWIEFEFLEMMNLKLDEIEFNKKSGYGVFSRKCFEST
jgi:hypothetical protein